MHGSYSWFESVTKNFDIAPPEELSQKETFLTQHRSMLTEFRDSILDDEWNSVEGDALSIKHPKSIQLQNQ